MTSSTVGGTTTEFTYNAAGMLATKTAGGNTTKFDYDPISAQLVGQRDGGTVTNQFTYGRELVAMTTGSDTDYYTTDELGSVVATRNASGALQKSYEYEPYGALVSEAGSGVASPLQYAGGLSLDADTYRFGLRHYDPTTATFTTPDPAETGETYSYASGNPVAFTDPLGLSPITHGGGPNFDSLLDGGPSRAWDDLINSSVVRHSIAGYNYLGGVNISRALKADPLDVAITVASLFPIGRGISIGKFIIGGTAAKTGVAEGKITGYTRHGLNQAISRDGHGVRPGTILDVVKNPTKVTTRSGPRGPTTAYQNRNGRVVLNDHGCVVTCIAFNRGARRY